jgi:hypothetical protein
MRTLSEVLVEDLHQAAAFGKIACVVISGDIITRGGWYENTEIGGQCYSGLDLAQLFLDDLSKSLRVKRTLFFVVPGNHDIVRQASGDTSVVQEFLLHYDHEKAFRTLREEFCEIYKLTPLNYVAYVKLADKTLVLGLLNSAYLNEKAKFSEYGFVGDDSDKVFSILGAVSSEKSIKMLVLHHHLLPIYEREYLGIDGKISMTLDAAKLLRQAQEANIWGVLHGHEHAMKKIHYSSWAPTMDAKLKSLSKSIALYAGGSAGAKQDRLPSDESNAYGLIDLSGDEPSVRVRRVYPGGRKGQDWDA